MKLTDHPHLDALCGEYLLGTLRGGARRRFECALSDEPLVALRLRHWQRVAALRPAAGASAAPGRAVWSRLDRELDLRRYRMPWLQRFGWALAPIAVLLVVLVVVWPGPFTPGFEDVARLAGPGQAATVTAAVSRDRTQLRLRASRPVPLGPQQSYELWLIPGEGDAPISVAVLGGLDARIALPPALAQRLRAGARLAVSVEPAGGSPTGAPTGPVILAGTVS